MHQISILSCLSRLIVEDVQERDAGIYQCHASNSVGEIGAAAELVIRNVAPTFSKQISDLTFYATAGKSVVRFLIVP